jgi:hypothetical protein
MPLRGQRWSALAAALSSALAGCATNDRVIHSVGAFGGRFTTIVQRPYVYGGGDFCGSRLMSGDGNTVWYDVFARASETECAALGGEFDTRSQSPDPFPGRDRVLNCQMTDPHKCDRVLSLHEELAQRFATSGSDGVGASVDDAENLREFFASDGRLIIRVMFGFDPDRPMSLECAFVTRHLDPDGYGTITTIICRDAARSWIVDAYMTEV